MNTKNQLICLWGGYAFFVFYLIGLILVAGFIPPPSPDLNAEEIAAIFNLHRWNILMGMSICVIASALYVPWSVAISGQMLRIEKARFAAFSYVQFLAGGVGAAFFMISPLFWITVAFRSSHVADSLLLLNDFAWLSWLISWPFFFVQEIAVGLCILVYGKTLIPRWVGYLSIWAGVSMIPVSAIAFFKTGPFAWDGLFGIYLPLILFAFWYNILSYFVLQAIKQESA